MAHLTRIIESVTHAIHIIEPALVRLVLLIVFAWELVRFALSCFGVMEH